MYFPDSDCSRFPKVQEQLPESETAWVLGAKCALPAPTWNAMKDAPLCPSGETMLQRSWLWTFLFLSDLEHFRVSCRSRGQESCHGQSIPSKELLVISLVLCPHEMTSSCQTQAPDTRQR